MVLFEIKYVKDGEDQCEDGSHDELNMNEAVEDEVAWYWCTELSLNLLNLCLKREVLINPPTDTMEVYC